MWKFKIVLCWSRGHYEIPPFGKEPVWCCLCLETVWTKFRGDWRFHGGDRGSPAFRPQHGCYWLCSVRFSEVRDLDVEQRSSRLAIWSEKARLKLKLRRCGVRRHWRLLEEVECFTRLCQGHERISGMPTSSPRATCPRKKHCFCYVCPPGIQRPCSSGPRRYR